jgi:hypothetical protein
MIINFSIPGAARVGPVVRRQPAVTFVAATTEREPARRPPRLICRWVADPVSGALHAKWQYPETKESTAAGIEEPDRLRLAA